MLLTICRHGSSRWLVGKITTISWAPQMHSMMLRCNFGVVTRRHALAPLGGPECPVPPTEHLLPWLLEQDMLQP